MGRHTSASRGYGPGINIAEIINTLELTSRGLSLQLQTPPDDVTVSGNAPDITGITKSSNGYSGLLGNSTDSVEIAGFYYFTRNNGTDIKKAIITIASNGTASLAQVWDRDLPKTIVAGDDTPRDYYCYGIATDGTDIYIVNNYNYVTQLDTEANLIRQYYLPDLIPGTLGPVNGTYNDMALAMCCDGTNLFVRSLYFLADDTLVGVVIFKLTLDGTLIRNTVENTDYHAILSTSSSSRNFYGMMTLHKQHIWMRHITDAGGYRIENYNLDFTRGNVAAYSREVSSNDSGYTWYYSHGGMFFDKYDNIHAYTSNAYLRLFTITKTADAIKVATPSIGIVADVGDRILIGSTSAIVSHVENDDIVHVSSNITPIELTEDSVSRQTKINDVVSITSLIPMTYGLRTILSE